MNQRKDRIEAIGERAKALQKAGYYEPADVEALRSMIRNGVALIECEFLLYGAEQNLRDGKSAIPIVVQRRESF